MKQLVIKVTITDPVWVRLTNIGLKVQREYCNDLKIPEPTPNPLGYFKYTLRQLMITFGKTDKVFQKNLIHFTRPSA